jgi:hemerythrin-like metal-binding protein
MGIFQWEEMYSVQVASFDRQHRGLFRAANELNEALLAGCGKEVAGQILQRLIDYTASHFAAEEVAMTEVALPSHNGDGQEIRTISERKGNPLTRCTTKLAECGEPGRKRRNADRAG